MLLSRTFILLSFLVGQASSAICDLCVGGANGLKRPYYLVDAHGTSCASKAMSLARSDLNSATCRNGIAQFRGPCCGNQEPNAIRQIPTKPPVYEYTGPVGPNPKCNLCRDGDYPSETSMVINLLYVGAGSCAQFYDYGQGGHILNHLCSALQFFAYEPCGCGIFNKNKNNNGYEASQSPPGNVPAPAPAQSPTQRPPSNNNANVNSNNSGNTKTPDTANDGKDTMKLGNQVGRGGQGGGRKRNLKGVTTTNSQR